MIAVCVESSEVAVQFFGAVHAEGHVEVDVASRAENFLPLVAEDVVLDGELVLASGTIEASEVAFVEALGVQLDHRSLQDLAFRYARRLASHANL